MEALLVYYTVEHINKVKKGSGNYLLAGLILRVAIHMAYHLDPAHTPEITTLQAKVRRRHRVLLTHVDDIMSRN